MKLNRDEIDWERVKPCIVALLDGRVPTPSQLEYCTAAWRADRQAYSSLERDLRRDYYSGMRKAR